MPTFAFKAKDLKGHALSGHREAPSADALAQELEAKGVIPLTIVQEDEERGDEVEAVARRLFERRVTLECGP